jgi:hypothetical protein
MPPSFQGTMTPAQQRQSMRLQRTEKRDRTHKLAKHLRDAEARWKGPRQSLCLYLKYKNQYCPPDNLWLGCTLFWEEGYFVYNKALMGAPLDGHWFIIYLLTGLKQGPYPLSVHQEPRLILHKKGVLASLITGRGTQNGPDLRFVCIWGRTPWEWAQIPSPCMELPAGAGRLFLQWRFSLNWGVRGASDRGAPMRTI